MQSKPMPCCAHTQLNKQMVGEQVWYACECGQKFRVEKYDGKVTVREPAAAPDHAREGALRKLRDAPLAKFLERGYHYNSQDDRNEAMGMGRDLANGIFDAVERALADGKEGGE